MASVLRLNAREVVNDGALLDLVDHEELCGDLVTGSSRNHGLGAELDQASVALDLDP